MSIQNLYHCIALILFFCCSHCAFSGEPNAFTQEEIKKVKEITGFDNYVKKRIEMPYDEAKKRWGEKSFDAQKFGAASAQDRAPMAVDLLNHKSIFLGKMLSELKSVLGRHDGFFWRDHIPAYLVEDGRNNGKKSWQIVFLAGMDQKIADIRIYQN
jgi:hypothetical protein